MLLYDYINEYDNTNPNVIDIRTKQRWLDTLEAELKDILSDRIPEDAKIVGVAPYDEVYPAYLRLKCAEAAGDTMRYNNALTLFETAREALIGYYLRHYTSREKVGWKNVL